MLSGGKWTPHDLRRTGTVIMVSLGVLPEVVERCLNHREQNHVKRIYQRHDYKKEMKAAWKLPGERIAALLSVKIRQRSWYCKVRRSVPKCLHSVTI
jgi:hypothetical protein